MAEQAKRFPPEVLAALIKSGSITTEDMKRMHPADIIQVIRATNENPKQDAAIKDSRDSMLSSPLMPPGVTKPIASLGSGWEGSTATQGAAKLWNGLAPSAGAAGGAAVAAKAGAPWWVGSILGGGLGSKLRFGSEWTKGVPAAAVEEPKWPISVEAKVDPKSLILNNEPRGNVVEKGNLIKPGRDASNFKEDLPLKSPGGSLGDEQNLRLNPQTGQRFAGDSPSKMDLPLRGRALSPGEEEGIESLGKLLGDAPTKGNGTFGKAPDKPSLFDKPSNLERSGTSSEEAVRELTSKTKAPWEDSRNTPLDTPGKGERSVESIQEEIAKLLDKATSKRKKPQ